MASSALDKAVVIASCSSLSSTRPFSEGQWRFFPSRGVSAEWNSCCPVSGWRSRKHRAVVCGLQLQSRRDFSSLSSSSSSSSAPWPSDELGRGSSRGSVVHRLGQNGTSMERGRKGRGRIGRGNGVVTMALPIDAYWITAAQALAVAGLMGGIAVVTGILINIRIEVQALAEFKELEAKGLLPEEMIVPDEDFEWDAPLYIFQTKELSAANPSSRNRPVREEFEPQLEPQLEREMKTELETATKE